MNNVAAQGVVLVLMLMALPLTSAGTVTGTTWLTVLGLASLGLGAVVPPLLRLRDWRRQD